MRGRMRTARVAHLSLLATGLVMTAAHFRGVARAGEPLPRSAEHVATPGGSVAANDTGDALVLNPANLAWLPGSELRWTWVRCPDDAGKVGCGHALGLSAALPFGFATSLRADLVQPPWGAADTEGVGFPYRGYEYTWITWGLAVRAGERLAF